jgi:hypothetical protein
MPNPLRSACRPHMHQSQLRRRPYSGMAGLPRNGWLASVGITGWFASEYAPEHEAMTRYGSGVGERSTLRPQTSLRSESASALSPRAWPGAQHPRPPRHGRGRASRSRRQTLTFLAVTMSLDDFLGWL